MERTISDSAEAPAGTGLWQRVRDAARQFGLRAFWHWWLGELAPLLPAGLRNAARRRRLRPVLAFGDDSAVLWVPRIANGKLGFEEAARIALSADPGATTNAGRAAISALPRVAYGGPVTEAKVVVALPESQVLRKTITLPAAVEDNLVQALAYDLDRHTPFKTDELYFDAAVVGRDSAKKEIRVELAAALRTTVDLARRRAESWGAVVVGVTPGPPPGGSLVDRTPLNLLPLAERPEASVCRRPEIWVPLALIALLAVAAVALPIWQKRGYAIALMQLAQQGRLQAEASSALRDQLEQLTGDYNFALQRKYAFPSAVQVVEDVTRLLPDDTWLTQFEVKSTLKGKEPSREILLRGESANAGRLISLLEDSKLFEQAAPRSPTTKIQPGPGEIFDLGAQLKPLPPPAAAPAVGPGRARGARSDSRRRRRDPHRRHRRRDPQRRRRRQEPHPRRRRRDPHPRRQDRDLHPRPRRRHPHAAPDRHRRPHRSRARVSADAPRRRRRRKGPRPRCRRQDRRRLELRRRRRGAGAQGAASAPPAQWVAPAQPSPAAKGAP